MPSLLLSRLRSALQDKGPQPEFHDLVMRRHRQEWPTLWAAIDHLMELDAQMPEKGQGWYDAKGVHHKEAR